MQLKLHGKKVQILESSYDPEKKRSRQKLFGSFPAETTTKYTVYNHVPDYNDLSRDVRQRLAPLFEYNEKVEACKKIESMRLNLEDLKEALAVVDKITPRTALRLIEELNQIKEKVKSKAIKREPKKFEDEKIRFKKPVRELIELSHDDILRDIGLLK